VTELSDSVYVSTTLGNALSHLETSDLNINENQLIHQIINRPVSRMPFTTIFKNITKLCAGSIFETDGDKISQKMYFMPKNSRGFDESLDEVISSYKGKDIIHGLSGGVDSVTMACSLLKNNVSFRSVTFNVDLSGGTTEGAEQARKFALELGIDHEVIDIELPPNKNADSVEKCMKHDLLNFTSDPHIGFFNMNMGPQIGIHGQNFDALASAKMGNPGYKIAFTLLVQPKSLISLLLKYIGYSIPLTEFGLNNHKFRLKYIKLISSIYPIFNSIDSRIPCKKFVDENKIIKKDNIDSCLIGVLDTGFPNIYQKKLKYLGTTNKKIHANQHYKNNLSSKYQPLEFLSEQIYYLFDICPNKYTNTQLLRSLLFHSYCNMHNKSIVNYLPDKKGSVNNPIMSAPLLNYFFNKKQSADKMLSPKQEVYDYMKSFTGKSFHDLKTKGHISSKQYQGKKSELVKRHTYRFTKDHSNLLPLVSKNTIFDKIYNETHKMMEENNISSRQESRYLHHMINIELLLDNLIDEN